MAISSVRKLLLTLCILFTPLLPVICFGQEPSPSKCGDSDYDCLVFQYSQLIALACKGEGYDCRIREYSRLIDSNPIDGAAYLVRARTYWTKEQELAIKDFNRAIELNPHYFQTYISLGILYCSVRNECKRSIVEFDRALNAASQNPNVHRRKEHQANAYGNRGFAHLREDEFENALADYDKAVELAPFSDIGYQGRGSVFAARGEVEKAIAEYDKVIELRPTDWVGYRHRGQLYKSLGQESKGNEDIKKSEGLKDAEDKKNSPSQKPD